jgi:pimeloyl-ACP methyl ester carboxylesterase
MIRFSTSIVVPCLFLVASSGLAQPIDPARTRTAYDSVAGLRNDIERSHGRFVTVNGIRMHYLEWGQPNGVPFVWAHGSAGTAYELRAVAPRLAQAGYRVLSVDWRGHGLTTVASYDFSIHHVADDLVGLLDSLRIPAAVFAGGSKGGSVVAAVYDEYPTRVLGLLHADGGTWSLQWMWDRMSLPEIRRWMSDPVPVITGPSEFDVFRQVVGNIKPGDLPIEWLSDMLSRIWPMANGEWGFIAEFNRMMGSYETTEFGITHPTTFPPLQWSENAMIPRVMFRRLHVPMMILDPQSERDPVAVTDQNERLAKDHPDLVTHRIYPDSGHNILQQRPDWLVRDAVELLDQVRKRRR